MSKNWKLKQGLHYTHFITLDWISVECKEFDIFFVFRHSDQSICLLWIVNRLRSKQHQLHSVFFPHCLDKSNIFWLLSDFHHLDLQWTLRSKRGPTTNFNKIRKIYLLLPLFYLSTESEHVKTYNFRGFFILNRHQINSICFFQS